MASSNPLRICYIGLGSNIDPEQNLRKASSELRELFPTIVFSSVYRTAPMYEEQQPMFLNAVTRVETEDPPEVLFEKLKRIEYDLQKNPPVRFGPRTIDLDLLLYDDVVLKGESEELVLPHPRMHERRFVLEPLCEIIEKVARHPSLGKSWMSLLAKTTHQQCERMKTLL